MGLALKAKVTNHAERPVTLPVTGLTYQKDLNCVVPGVFRLGGLDIRRPKDVRYGDGI